MSSVLIRIVNLFFTVLYFMILARVIFSWFPNARRGFLVEALYIITEPILAPIRNFLRRFQSEGSMLSVMDLSPLIAFLLLRIVNSVIIGIIA